MNRNSKAIRKYQSRYSSLVKEGQQAFTQFFAAHRYEQATVIPAFNETPDFIDRFASLPNHKKTLLIIVANTPRYASMAAREQTQALVSTIAEKHAKENVMKGVTFGQLNLTQDILLLDITVSRPQWLKSLQSGVGFARKAGMDVALSLYCDQRINSPWIYCSDADAEWPLDYLTVDKTPLTQKGALVFAFNHHSTVANRSLSTAGALYDLSLRYYVMGLRWAESPWAYHTVGSTLLVHCNSYAETHGFPIREAGEDFYLLNKIAKSGRIYCPLSPCIRLSDRTSDRVPFGTGPALNNINQQDHPLDDFKLYHPHIFTLLKAWHQTMPTLFPHYQLSSLPKEVVSGLQHLGIAKALTHCERHASNETQFVQQLWQWFDGFRTLKLIHWLRDHYFASVSFNTWKNHLNNNQIPFINQPNDNNLEPIQLNHHIQQQEDLTLPFRGGLQ